MALIRLTDGRNMEVSAETGNRIWEILQGRAEPDEAEERICMLVKRIYLSWQNAPDDYIEQRFDSIAAMVVAQWMVWAVPVGSDGRQHTVVTPAVRSRPEIKDVVNREFSKKWGLLKDGAPTDKARRYM